MLITQSENVRAGQFPCKDFWDYVAIKDSRSKVKGLFEKMGPDEKKELFLRWKWGSSDPLANNESETTRRYLMSVILKEGIDKYPEGEVKDYWKKVILFETECEDVLVKIGYLNTRKLTKPKVVDQIVQKVADQFYGSIESAIPLNQ